MARLAPISESMDMATVTNRVVLRSSPGEGVAADGGYDEEVMADGQEEEAMRKARDGIMTKIKNATMTVTETETETHAGALTKNDIISTMCCSHWKLPGVSKRMWSIN
jgi:hypothetical protein